MIQQQTLLKVSDNSGAKIAKCIKILGGFKKKIGRVGDTIIVSIQQLRNKSKKTSKVKKGEIYKAVILRTKKQIKNKEGVFICFHNNAISLINKQNSPIATRIIGPISKKLKKNYKKFASISVGFI
jgi:large subunit ribosomal protein L14